MTRDSEQSPDREQAEGSLERMALGDRSAFLDCVKTYGRMVTAIASRAVSNSHDREDLVQEIFLDLWKASARFDPSKGSELTFVATIARRRVVDRLRKAQRTSAQLASETDVAEVALNPESNWSGAALVEGLDELNAVKQAMTQLRPDERKVIEMSVLEGATQAEIAARMATPLGTVKTLARRGMMRLRELVAASSPTSFGSSSVAIGEANS